MESRHITIVTFGFFKAEILEGVAGVVNREFHYPVAMKEAHIDLGVFYDAGRRQYNGNDLLKKMTMFWEQDAVKNIGLFSVDLFIPILTYIFGQAYLGGYSAIASTFRLGNERYGMKSDEHLFLERLSKEVIHELGHCFGLVHCHTPACVMQSSTYVEDIDQKSTSFCGECRKTISFE